MVNTFVPDRDSYYRSALALKRQHLGKQRVESLQIMCALLGVDKHGAPRVLPPGRKPGWSNHTAARMWRGHELALLEYTVTMCIAWKRLGELARGRAYSDTIGPRVIDIWQRAVIRDVQQRGDEWRALEAVGVSRDLLADYREDRVWSRPHYAPPPSWWGDSRVHRSHQRALYCKDPTHYGVVAQEMIWDSDLVEEPVESGYRYYWPVPGAWGEVRFG